MDQNVSPSEMGVRDVGQLPSPDELCIQIEVATLRVAEAQRIVLEGQLEIAKLLKLLNDAHGYKSRRLIAVARNHGNLTRTDCYDLMGLAGSADDIIAEHDAKTRADPRHQWPSWRQAVKDLQDDEDHEPGCFWITPPKMYADLDAEFGFGPDPFPYPRAEGYDALAEDCEWPQSAYVNASYRTDDEGGGRSLTKVAHKAIAESKKGKTIVLPVPCYDALATLLAAGAEVRPLGRVRWLHTRTGEPCPHPGICALVILRGKKPDEHGSPPD